MTSLEATPNLDTFRVLAKDRRVIPVVRRLLADEETPVGLYRKLAQNRPGTFLLESAEYGGVWSRYSFIGARSSAVLSERDGQAVWHGTPPVGMPHGEDPWLALRGTLAALHTPRLPDLPPLTGGLVGYVSYDAVRRLERLPERTHDDLGLPEIAFLLATDIAVLDHEDGTVLLVANAVNWDDTDERVDQAWADAVTRLDRMTEEIAAPTPSSVAAYAPETTPRHHSRTPRPDYLAAIAQAKEQIRAGEAFQIVVSQRFEATTSADALDIYRVLRQSNPSPYMYLLRLPG
ncbi:MAG TPA: chorismate-binding protein, partial [Jiangellaceae bacterium]